LSLKKIAVVGYGNMGKRHVDSLLKLGVDEIVIVRRGSGQPVEKRHAGIEVIGSLQDAIEQGAEAVVIANVTSAHAESLRIAMLRGLPVLVEKPVAHDLETLSELLELSQSSASNVVVGYDLRFCGALDQLSSIIESGVLGDIASANFDAGGYLPIWRPELDYRELYSSTRRLGGGVVLDLVHEMDSMIALFGSPDYVTATISKKSDLEIDVEDVAHLTFDYDAGPIVGIRLDYLRRPFYRSYTLIGTNGTAVWDEQAGDIRVYGDGSDSARVVWSDQIQNAFEEEMRHFLDVVKGRSQSLIPLEVGIASAQLALAAHQSSELNRRLDLAKLL
jgi:predicted dehydrogenase